MYCRNCGNVIPDEAAICVKCGVPVGKGNLYCSNCGTETHPEAVVCVTCGVSFVAPEPEYSSKSKIAAGLLGIFLGAFGVHNFYLGNTGKAVGQLLSTLIGWVLCGVGPVFSATWGLVEGIMILCGSIDKDASGKKLKD